MTIYMIYQGYSDVSNGKIQEKPVSAKLKESEAQEFLCNWAADFDRNADIFDWKRYGEKTNTGYGKIGYFTNDQERWCRYEPREAEM